ncbi:MAG: hypothetical protein M3P46_11675 [Actinomycetota bacterium]|nr:hypothetical protein [Actinomycetota bacterium]
MARPRPAGIGAARAAGGPELLDLLGATYARMSDLPAAGAAWLLSARPDAEIAPALEALRLRYARPQVRASALHVGQPLSAYPPAAQERLRGLGLLTSCAGSFDRTSRRFR